MPSLAEGGIRLPISKSNALGALFQLSRGNIVPGFHAFECAGIQTISLIDKRQTIVSLPLQDLYASDKIESIYMGTWRSLRTFLS